MLDEKFRPYISGKYKEWEAAEDNADRIADLVPEDKINKVENAAGVVRDVPKTDQEN